MRHSLGLLSVKASGSSSPLTARILMSTVFTDACGPTSSLEHNLKIGCRQTLDSRLVQDSSDGLTVDPQLPCYLGFGLALCVSRYDCGFHGWGLPRCGVLWHSNSSL